MSSLTESNLTEDVTSVESLSSVLFKFTTRSVEVENGSTSKNKIYGTSPAGLMNFISRKTMNQGLSLNV